MKAKTFIGLVATENSQHLVDLSALVASGAITPAVDRSFPLAETADAIRYLRAGRARGKIVVST